MQSNCETMTDRSETTQFTRLPTTVTPIHYDITLKPNLKSFTFSGSEVIKVVVNEETERIVLNAKAIDIRVASFTPNNGKTLSADRIVLSVETETVSLEFNEPLITGTGVLRIEFSGCLNDKLKGFYRSKYTTPYGREERYAAVTHFEPTYARQAFPNWDEPAVKATFDITLVIPINRVGLSNSTVISEIVLKDDPNLKEVKFATTPFMSTYLVAVIIGEFDYVEDMTSDGVTVRVYTPLERRKQGLFALEVAVKALPYYKDYFNIAYPLPKLDLIAIADFAMGAMENWGLITFAETGLLVDPQNTSTIRKQWTALTVAHELCHQWFGNLVTMEWWTDLWLKEGLATFMSYLCVDHMFSEYQIWTEFVWDMHSLAMDLDALNNSHPIQVPVLQPSDIENLTHVSLTYNKGAAVLRVLHNYIGDEPFRKGMYEYLKQHSYKNALTQDLWSALQGSSDKPVGDLMNTWTKQKGFPIISVTSLMDGNSRILSLTQEKFYADREIPASESGMLWKIPIVVSRASAPNEIAAKVLMESKTIEIKIPNIGNKEWIKLNPNTVGLYRVQYSTELLTLLLPAVSDKSLSPLDRLGLQNDLFALVQSGHTSTADILELLDAFANEDNYNIWKSIDIYLVRLDKLLSHTELEPLFHEFGRELLSRIHSRLGWEPIKDETELDTLLRSLVTNRLASFGDQTVISVAKKLFESHLKGTHVIPQYLRQSVYRALAFDCEDKTFDALFKLYCGTELYEDKMPLFWALGSVRNPNQIAKVLEFSLSTEVRTQDCVHLITSMALTKTGRDMGWEFFRRNIGELKRRYANTDLGEFLVRFVSENFASEERAQELETFFANNPFPGTERTVQESLERIRLNDKWIKRDLESIRSYLSNRLNI